MKNTGAVMKTAARFESKNHR